MKKHMAFFFILIWTLIWALCVAPALAEPEASGNRGESA